MSPSINKKHTIESHEHSNLLVKIANSSIEYLRISAEHTIMEGVYKKKDWE